jgi:hypothetical protein
MAKREDMATANPVLAAEWHLEKNGDLRPTDVSAVTKKRLWWKCSLGHEWQATGRDRNNGSGCPVCAGQRAWPGYNDMATMDPTLASEWHPTKNGELTPSDVMTGTNKLIWWRCALGHEWQAKGSSRRLGTGCPFCSGNKVEQGYNDLATINPELADEWHPTKNGELMPTMVSVGANKLIWWRCALGHEWQAKVVDRNGRNGCPICSGSKVLIGYNDLATTNPHLAADWHPTKNGERTPQSVSAGTGVKIWWRCALGHEWQASGSDRNRGVGCPVCAGVKVLTGHNDMLTTNPSLAAEWHPTKNGQLRPSEVVEGTSKSIWWRCVLGHEWQAKGSDRSRGSSCPVCSGRTAWAGHNDMLTTNPSLAAEWHPTKNGDLTPSQVVGGTHRRIWWRCAQGHEWVATPHDRSTGAGCPACAERGFDPSKPSILYFIENRSLAARKIGITNVGNGRLEAFAKRGWRQLGIVTRSDGWHVQQVETAMLRWIRLEHALPRHLGPEDMKTTGGWSETFGQEGPTDHEILSRIKDEFVRVEQHSDPPAPPGNGPS